jgi:glycosyltransferase involved in cell wall biosynthesis
MARKKTTPGTNQRAKRLSVVVASYQRGTLIRQLIDDLDAQSLDHGLFEVLIVDDGSTDPVQQALQGRETSFALSVIRQDNQGQAAARHRGIERASAPVVVIVDDDMRLPPGFLAAHLQAHDNGATVVLGHIRPSASIASMPLFERFHAWLLDKQVAAYARGEPARGSHVCTGNVSFRREDYRAVGGFDPVLKRSEDRDLGIRLERAGARLVFSPHAYTIHESDHTNLDVWMRRAHLYGVYDSKIAQRYPDDPSVDPWAFFFMVNPLTRPFLVAMTLAPGAGQRITRGAVAASTWFDARGVSGVALRGMTFVYGMEYFRGMRENAGSVRASAKNLGLYLRRRAQKSRGITG